MTVKRNHRMPRCRTCESMMKTSDPQLLKIASASKVGSNKSIWTRNGNAMKKGPGIAACPPEEQLSVNVLNNTLVTNGTPRHLPTDPFPDDD